MMKDETEAAKFVFRDIFTGALQQIGVWSISLTKNVIHSQFLEIIVKNWL